MKTTGAQSQMRWFDTRFFKDMQEIAEWQLEK